MSVSTSSVSPASTSEGKVEVLEGEAVVDRVVGPRSES